MKKILAVLIALLLFTPIAQSATSECLNLESVLSHLTGLPSSTEVRYHTKAFQLDETLSTGTSVRRNFAALMALNHFSFEQISLRAFLNDLPQTVQQGCESVEMKSQMAGSRIYRVEYPLRADELKLMLLRKDPKRSGQLVATGLEIIYTLKNSRQLEINMTSKATDPCPNFRKAKGHTVQEITWGSPEELLQIPLEVSRQYIGLMSLATEVMSPELLNRVAQGTNEMIDLNVSDMQGLKRVYPSSNSAKCPRL